MCKKLKLILFMVCFFNTRSLSAKIEDYTALMGSDWARENPGQLPYEKCFIEESSHSASPTEGDTFNLFFILWKNPTAALTETLDDFYLGCESPNLRLSFRLPLNLSSERHGLGFNLGTPWGLDLDGTLEVSGLDHNTLGDTLGKYKGKKWTGGTLFWGKSQTKVKNQAKIQFLIREKTFGTVFGIKESEFSLSLKKNVSLESCLDHYLLLKEPSIARQIPEGCTPNQAYSNIPERTEVVQEALTQLRFIEIDEKGFQKHPTPGMISIPIIDSNT